MFSYFAGMKRLLALLAATITLSGVAYATALSEVGVLVKYLLGLLMLSATAMLLGSCWWLLAYPEQHWPRVRRLMPVWSGMILISLGSLQLQLHRQNQASAQQYATAQRLLRALDTHRRQHGRYPADLSAACGVLQGFHYYQVAADGQSYELEYGLTSAEHMQYSSRTRTWRGYSEL